MEQVKTLFRRYPKAFTQEEAMAAITSTPGKYLGEIFSRPLDKTSRFFYI
jgi:hypothetical protein